jgi:hypothetical protein
VRRSSSGCVLRIIVLRSSQLFIDNMKKIDYSILIQYKKYSNPHLDAFSK